MAFVPLYGVEINTTAPTAAGAGQIQIDPNVAQQLVLQLGGNYTYASISDGVNYEIIRIDSVNPPNLIVTRGQDGTTTSAFPQGACIRYVWTAEGIAAVAGSSGVVLTGNGALVATQTGPNAWTLNVLTPVITGSSPIEVLGAYPAWEIATAQVSGNCCCGSGSSGGGGTPITITGSGIVTVTGTSPSFNVGAAGVNLIGGAGISVVGSYPTFTISATGGGGGTGVQSITGSAKILLSGTPQNPTISLATTGVGAGTFNGITYDAYGTITAVNLTYVPLTSLITTTPAFHISLGSGPSQLALNVDNATTTEAGLVQLAPATNTGSNNTTDSTSAVTPAGINAVLAAYVPPTPPPTSVPVRASSNYTADPVGNYTNTLSSNITFLLSATQSALITATASASDSATASPPQWGLGVFQGATLVQGIRAIYTGDHTIQFVLNGPLGSTNLSLRTTTLNGTTSVISQSITAILTPN